MGCGVSAGVVISRSDSLIPDMPPTEVFKYESLPTEPISFDIEQELLALKKSSYLLLTENERLKQELSRDMAKLFPQVFHATESLDDVVEDWLLMDLYEGDNYMNYLAVVFPPAADLVDAVRELSVEKKNRDTSLREFLAYFRHRFDQQGKVLGLMGEEKRRVDDCVLRAKAKLVSAIKLFESKFGKKSREIDALTATFASIQREPCGEEFITGLQTFQEQTLAFHVVYYEAKLRAAAEAQNQLKADHLHYLEELSKQHQEQLQAKDDHLATQRKQWEVLVRKQIDEINTQAAAHRLDLDNQLLHFDSHCRKLQMQSDEEKQEIQTRLDIIITGLRQEIAGRDSIIRKRDESIYELESLTALQKQANSRLQDLQKDTQRQLQELKDLAEEQKLEIDDFAGHMTTRAEIEQRCSDLQLSTERALEAEKQLQAELNWAQEECRSREERIKELEAHMSKEAKQQKKMWAQTTTLRFMTRFAARIKLEKAAVLLVWNAITLTEASGPVRRASLLPSPYPHNIIDALADDTFDSVHEQFASSVLQTRCDLFLRTSELSEMYAVVTQKEKPMAVQQLFKVVEDMMARKYESDQTDIRNERVPRAVPAFLFEHLMRSVGLRPLAVKALNQFVPALQQLYAEGHPYGLVICQLLQVLHEAPVSYLLGLYLTEAWALFDPLTQKFAKIKAERSSKRGQKQGPIVTPRMRKQMQLKPYLGGQAFLQDVMTLVYARFDSNRSLGEKVIRLLQPEDLSLEEFVTFLICQKMAKLGRAPESLFRVIDTSKDGFISETEFVTQLREALDLWLPEVSLRVLYRSMTKKDKNLSVEVFTSSINFAAYTGNCTSEVYSVSTCGFLTALVEVYRENEWKFAMKTKKTLDNKEIKVLGWDVFQQFLLSLDPYLGSGELSDLWTIALRNNSETDAVSPDQLVSILLDYPISPLRDSVFCKLQVDRKEVVALVLRASAAGSTLSTAESAHSLSPSSPRLKLLG